MVPQISVAQTGSRTGLPVVLFHGWPGSRLQRTPDRGLLRELDVRLITMDRPGIAGSGAQPGRQLVDWPPVMEAVADRLGLKSFHLVGVSAGAPYALACAHGIPHRLRSVSILGGLAPQPVMRHHAPIYQKARFFYTLIRHHPRVARWILHLMRRYLATATSPLPALVVRRLPASDQQALGDARFSRMLLRDFRRAFRKGIEGPFLDAVVLASDWGFEISEITMEVHLWHGLADTVVPPGMGRYLAGELPRCREKWEPELGHYGLVAQCLREVIEVMRQQDANR
ncbi:MAG: alpha/beta hydrolase [Candidatus Sumerlaeia bacterium]|nr:alpha/beta hydrolase [Candidatus Sumerlaeia bacterium]